MALAIDISNYSGPICIGGPAPYRRGCRCDTCRAYKSAVAHRFYERHKERLKARALDWHRGHRESVAAGAKRRLSEYQDRLLPLKGHPCMDCGGRFPVEAMDFDHRPGATKDFSLSRGLGHRWEDVIAEIAKCDLVCANCHRVRTARRVRGDSCH